MDRSLAHGIAWTAAVKWAGQFFTWAAALVVARILGPAAYGLVGMAAIYMSLVSMLSEFGIGTAIVTLRELSPDQVAQLNAVALGFGAAAMCVSLLAAQPLAHLFGQPQVALIVLGLSPTLVLSAFQNVPTSLLQRDMRFKLLAGIEITTGFATCAATVTFAVLHFGFWALVLGQVVGAVMSTTLLLIARPARFAWPRRGETDHAFRFSRHTLITRLAWYVYSNADFTVVGRVLGKTALGIYTIGWEFANLPLEKVTALVGRVTPPVLAAVRHDPPALRRYLLLLTEGIALITFPATVGIALVSRPFVLSVLGEQWSPAIRPMQILAAYSGFRSIAPLIMNLLTALGETAYLMRSIILAAVVFPVAFIIGSHWGIAGVAIAWMVVHPLIVWPSTYRRAFTLIQLPIREYVAVLLPAITGSATMSIAVLATAHELPQSMNMLLRLVCLSAVGAVTYIAVLALAFRTRVERLVTGVRTLRSR